MISPGSLYISQNDNLGGVHFPSRDKMWLAELPPFRIYQTKLAVARQVGEPFVLADWFVSPDNQHGPIPTGFPIRFLGVDNGGNPAVVRCNLVMLSEARVAYGSDWQGGPDQAIAAGTRIDGYPDRWNNTSLVPANRVLAPNLVVNGKSTRWPAGLKNGQSFPSLYWFDGDGVFIGKSGLHHWRAYGSGKIKVRATSWSDALIEQVVTFTNGTPSPATLTFSGEDWFNGSWDILESDPLKPLHTPRLIPDADVAAFDAHETQVPNDHHFTIVDADHIADHGPGLVSRYIDGPMPVNHSYTKHWTPEVEEWFRKIVLLCNACKTMPWISTPHMATDGYVAAKVQFLHDNLDPDVPVGDEHSNEVWNSFFQQANHCSSRGAIEFCDLRVVSLTYAGGIVTATTLGDHPFQTGDQVVIEGSFPDKAYNGQVRVTRTGARSYTYAPLSTPTTPAATTREGNRLIGYSPTAPDVTVFTQAIWHRDAAEIELVPSANHAYAGQERIYLSGFDDPALNGVYRIDTRESSPGVVDRSRLFLFYVYQGGASAIPSPAPPGGSVAKLPAPGQTIRGIRLGGWDPLPANPYWRPNGETAQLWHARRSAQIHKAFTDKFAAIPGRVVRILGLFALGGNETAMDRYNADALALGIPPESPKAGVIAPYVSSQEDEIIWSRHVAGAVVEVDDNSITVANGVATVNSGTYWRPEGPNSPTHGMTDGSRWTVVNIEDKRFCGPTTVTVLSPTSFSFPVPGVPSGTVATKKQGNSRMRFSPGSGRGREILSVAAIGGRSVRMEVPRHGFSPGDVFDFRDFRPTKYNGLYAIDSVTPDTLTITVPTLNGAIMDAGDRRCWMTPESLVLELVDVCRRAVPSGKVEGPISANAAVCRSRGFEAGCYEFGTHLIAPPQYGEVEPVNYALQAMNAHPGMEQVVYDCYRSMYKHNYWFCANYGRVGVWNKSGYWSFANFTAQVSAKVRAVRRAVIDFGRKKVAPLFDLDPRESRTNTPRTITAKGIGTGWAAGQTVRSANGTVSSVVVDQASQRITFRYRAGPTTGPDSVTIGTMARSIDVTPAGVRRIFLHPPFLEANKPTGVEIVGDGTAWDAQTEFLFDPGTSTTTGTIANLAVDGAGHATATMTAAGTGVLSLSDTTVAYPIDVVPQGTTPTAPRMVLDDSQAGNGSVVVVGNWDGWNQDGYLGGYSYREGRNKTSPASHTYKFAIPESGRYEVAPSWVGAGNRATDAKYSVSVNGGIPSTYAVNQTVSSIGAWPAGNVHFQPIGTVDVEAGDEVVVVLSGFSDVYNVIADAVMVRKIGEVAPRVAATGFTLSGPSSGTAGTPVALTVSLSPPGSTLSGARTVTITDDGDGTATPTSLNFADGSTTSQTASFSKPTAGTAVVTATPSPDLGGARSMSITFVAGESALVPGTIQVGARARTSIAFSVVGTSGGRAPRTVQRQIKRSADSAWTDVGAPNSTTPATGLTAGTSYDLRATVADAAGGTGTTSVVTTPTPAGGPKLLAILRQS